MRTGNLPAVVAVIIVRRFFGAHIVLDRKATVNSSPYLENKKGDHLVAFERERPRWGSRYAIPTVLVGVVIKGD